MCFLVVYIFYIQIVHCGDIQQNDSALMLMKHFQNEGNVRVTIPYYDINYDS